MIQTLVEISLAAALASLPALAQITSPPPDPNAVLTPDLQRLRRNPNATREACLSELDASGAVGADRRTAFRSCFERNRREYVTQARLPSVSL